MAMNIYLTLLPVVLFLMSCQPTQKGDSHPGLPTTAPNGDRIPVLNVGTFHFGFTTDASSTDFDENDRKNQQAAHQLARRLAEFRPTVIVVENIPERDSALQSMYLGYRQNPDTVFAHPNEVTLVAFEVGRLSGAKHIYGIDHKMGYNYRIESMIDNTLDPEIYRAFMANPNAFFPGATLQIDSLSLTEKFKMLNQPRTLDLLITINADILTHVGTEGGFEGADEAARYYQRNLRMFANLHRLPLKPDDRVFLLMGASHTAYFRDFMSRSPKYQMVSALDYLTEE